MNMNSNIFLIGNNGLPDLYMDMVLAESTRPILFTCTDFHDDLYICSCHCANGEKCEWIIIPTTPERVVDLLENKLAIRDIFTNFEEYGFIATLYAGEKGWAIKKIPILEIPDEILPTANYFMEAEEDEFTMEIADLTKIHTGKPLNLPLPDITKK